MSSLSNVCLADLQGIIGPRIALIDITKVVVVDWLCTCTSTLSDQLEVKS